MCGCGCHLALIVAAEAAAASVGAKPSDNEARATLMTALAHWLRRATSIPRNPEFSVRIGK